MISPGEFLTTITQQKQTEVTRLYDEPGLDFFKTKAAQTAPGPDFTAAIKSPGLNLIAEVKKASPSRGIIRPDFDAVTIARDFESAGAAAISVLTDTIFFQGQITYLEQIRAHTTLPLLRKDFIIDPIQVYEARAYGASAILLIAAILTDKQAHTLSRLAAQLQMAVLFEVHNEAELHRALALESVDIIGINNRDLHTFHTDISTAETINTILESHSNRRYTVVAESGYNSRHHLTVLAEQGFQAVLIGEGLAANPELIAFFK